MFKPARTKALYAGSFDPITRGHLDIVFKALRTFDAVHVAIGTNVTKQRAFPIQESLALIAQSIQERWDGAHLERSGDNTPKMTFFDGSLEIGEFENQSLTKYARAIGATHIVRGLRGVSNFSDEFNLHGVAERIDPSLPMVHFICEAQFLHVSSSTAKELHSVGEDIGWLVMPCVQTAFDRSIPRVRRDASK